MKQILLLIAFVGTFSINAIAQSKVGHVNSQEILAALPERVEAEQKAEAFAKEKENLIQAMVAEYQGVIAKAQGLPETATQTERLSLQNQLVELEERIGKAQQTAQQEIASFEQELVKPMLDRVQNAINAVAGANGFAYILDTSTGVVVFADGGEDIGPLVKANLGLQ
ncbi:MAG: OmpH family outer membrane protein [Bacteroidota bacterium]